MRHCSGCACLALVLACFAFAQQAETKGKANQIPKSDRASATAKMKQLLEANVRTEWEAFKKKDKKAYSDLLADDFVAVEDDGEGTRNKYAAANEIDKSVVNNYHLFVLNVMPLEPNAAFVTYEVTIEFPPKAQVKLKRVLVSELWLKRDGQWKARYYQETRVR
jgi:hypothetical protein